ncbi:MAG: glycosyltransferase [Bacteroidota bacterium]
MTDREKFYVFSDDGSTDRSKEILHSLFKNNQFAVLGDGSNSGPGFAFNKGFEWILSHSKSDADRIVTLEADNTSDISILPKMVTIAELGYDLVLASVYAQGGGFD